MKKPASIPQIISLEAWRQNEQLVGWAFKMFNTPEWRLLQAIMQDFEHIRFHREKIPSDQQLGRIEGWDSYYTVLKRAADPLTTQGPMPEATFENPELPQTV